MFSRLFSFSPYGRFRAVRFYWLLRSHIVHQPHGQQVLADFNLDPVKAGPQMAGYLRSLFASDPELVSRLAKDAGAIDPKFATIVLGGQVDQIVNVARVGAMHVHIYIFKDTRQVLAVLCVGLAVAAAVLFWYLLQSQPPGRANGTAFYIAVADFVQTGSPSDFAQEEVQTLYADLAAAYEPASFEHVQVEHERVGQIHSEAEASRLAERIHADLVIYGNVIVDKDTVRLYPSFHVADSYRADLSEVTGLHKFSEVILYPTGGPLAAKTGLEQRSMILVDFTKALVYTRIGQYQLAGATIQQAIQEGDQYGQFNGKEALYLLAARIARLGNYDTAAENYADQALQINPYYGRAYIAKGNIAYNQGNLYAANLYYSRAAVLRNQPFGAYVTEKANLGLANTCAEQYKGITPGQARQTQDAKRLVECAQQGFSAVIDAFRLQNNQDKTLRELAVTAYINAGLLYENMQLCAASSQVFEQARKYSQSALDSLQVSTQSAKVQQTCGH